jgi:hypothetical protein
MDLLVEKMHYTRFNAINKSEIILARKWFCTLDICIRKSTKIRSGHFDSFFIFFGFNSNSRLTYPFKKEKKGFRKKRL